MKEPAGATRDGLGLLEERFANGPPVPMGELFGMAYDEVERGRVVFSCEASPRFANPMGGLHGGVAATMLDSVMGCAVQSVLDPGEAYTTLTIEVKYLRPVAVDGAKLRAEGRLVHRGRRQATAEGSLTDAAGTLVATATTTCIVMR